MDAVLHPPQHLVRREPRKPLPRVHEVVLPGAVDAGGKRLHPLLDPVLRGRDQLRRGGGCRGAQVGDEVRDGEVHLVPDRRDDGQLRRRDDARKLLVVEAGEVLDRPAAAREDDDVYSPGVYIEPANASRDRPRALRALHHCRVDQQIQPGVAAADDVDDVLQRRAGGRGDDADTLRKRRQRSLGPVEEALRTELLLELLEGPLQRTRAQLLHGLGDELELAARLVDRDFAANLNLHPVFGAKTQQLRLPAEEHDGKLRLCTHP